MKRARIALGLVLLAAGTFLLLHRGRRGSEAAAGPAPDATAPVRADPWAAPAEIVRWPVRYERFETLTTRDGLPSDHVTCVLATGDELAVGTDRGVAVRRAGAWTLVREKDGLSHDLVTSLARDPETGDYWIGTIRGLTRLSGGKPRVYHQLNSGLVNDIVYHVTVDGPRVWAATQAGASVLDTSTGAWAVWDHRNSIMHEPWCYAVAHGPGRVWIGLWGGAIIERDLGTGLWREYRDPDGEFELDLYRDDGPIHEVTSFLCYDAGVLWQATYFGLSRFDGRQWDSYVAKDTGIPGDFVQHVASRGHTVWIGTDEGFGAFDGSTAVSYKRRPDGRCAVSVWKDGKPVESSTLDTAPGDNYVLWTQPGPDDVWIATGHGLSHGFAAKAAPASAPR
jgi:ligand-binding sensor domain-containing protein